MSAHNPRLSKARLNCVDGTALASSDGLQMEYPFGLYPEQPKICLEQLHAVLFH